MRHLHKVPDLLRSADRRSAPSRMRGEEKRGTAPRLAHNRGRWRTPVWWDSGPPLRAPSRSSEMRRKSPQRGKCMSWASQFNLLDGTVILRLICALFFVPHVVGKFTEPATLNFFKAAKFNPPATWMYIAGSIETVLTVLLVLGIYTPY